MKNVKKKMYRFLDLINKQGAGVSSFFPKTWNKQRIFEEIASAIKDAKTNGSFGNVNGKVDMWEGISSSGITIQGYKNTSSSGLATSWPKL